MLNPARFLSPKFAIFLAVLCSSCSGLRTVKFPNKIDTQDKPITLQDRQTKFIPDMGVYVSNDFPSARFNDIGVKNDSTIVVQVQPENQPINNSAYFAFKAWGDKKKQISFQFEYPNGYQHRYVPKYKVANGSWQQADSTMFSYMDSVAILKIKISPDTVLIAAQELQTIQNVKSWYTELQTKTSSRTRVNIIGKSHLGNDIPMLDICDGSPEGKDIIVLLTRQHPPEVTGYLAFQSFLETVVMPTDLNTAFFKKYRVLAFPLMNPDGVDLGHWRHNAGGVDLNRDWSKYRQPEIAAVVSRIEKIVKEYKVKVLLGLDFHSTWHDVFYTNVQRENTNLPSFVSDWFASLEANIPNYKVNEKSATSTRPVSKGWFLKRFNAVGITYEIGDETPRDFITLKGKISANEMMKLLTTN